MWEALLFVSSFLIIYLGIKMCGSLCCYTPWGCYYRGSKPVYIIAVTNNSNKDEIMNVFRRSSENPISIIVVNDYDTDSNFYKKTVNIVRALIDSNIKKYHVILLLETSNEYSEKFQKEFTDIQVCEDIEAMLGNIIEYDSEEYL